MKYRLYPTKDTTLVEGTQYNSGLNEVTELWYGESGLMRHVSYFDMSPWLALIQRNLVPSDITDVDCTLKMFNCFPTEQTYYNPNVSFANGVDVEVRALSQGFDEGTGHLISFTAGTLGVSNWYSATSLVAWSSAGGDYSTATTFTQHFDSGSENLTGDVSSLVQTWCGGTNNGIVVKFSDATEALDTDASLTKFYTRNTHTIFKPYVEFSWEGTITDQRVEAGYGLTKRLYLFTHEHGKLENVSDISGVTISYSHPSLSGSSDTYTGSSIVNQYPGVYYVEATFPSYPGVSGDDAFTDTWDIDFDGRGIYTSSVYTGSLTSNISQWNVNDETAERVYDISLPHIRDTYKTSDIVFLDVDVYERYTSTKHVLRDLQYRVDLVDGENRFEMIDWETVSYTPIGNTILFNFSWFLPGSTYELRFRRDSYGDEELHGELSRRFNVIYE